MDIRYAGIGPSWDPYAEVIDNMASAPANFPLTPEDAKAIHHEERAEALKAQP